MEEIYQPPGPPPELRALNRDEAIYWGEARKRYEHVRRSVVDHLKYENPDKEVAIRRVEHLLPDLIEYQIAPIELTDERLYRVLLDQNVQEATSE